MECSLLLILLKKYGKENKATVHYCLQNLSLLAAFPPKTLINPPFFSPSDSMRWSKWRFVMLALACVFVIGEYYCHDNKTEIQEKIEQELEID